jgi:nucleoside-diphosphate-sugar epimerase
MNVVISGGAGFLGRRLTSALLSRGTLKGPDGRDVVIDEVRIVDLATPPAGSDLRIVAFAGDLADDGVLTRAVDRHTAAVFHLAAVVSGQAEADFELGLRVNLDASRHLLDHCRRLGHAPRLVFTSSVAVYGGALPEAASEAFTPTPQTSYGTEKAMIELAINDYARRGFVDGRALRLPTIVVRPGKPNAAASSVASGIIREPLNGVEAVCPVDPETRMWLLSPATVVACLIAGHDLPADAFGPTRVVNLPGLSVRVADMVATLERVAGADVAARVRWEPDARIARMAAGWPGRLDDSRARALGFPADDSFDAMVQQYIRDELGGRVTTGAPR